MTESTIKKQTKIGTLVKKLQGQGRWGALRSKSCNSQKPENKFRGNGTSENRGGYSKGRSPAQRQEPVENTSRGKKKKRSVVKGGNIQGKDDPRISGAKKRKT